MENSKRQRKSIKLSASTISDYLQCPRKVYYRLYYPDLVEKSEALVLGSLVHDTLEKYWNNFLDAVKYINTSDVSNKIKESAIKMIGNYFSYFSDLVSEKDDIEKFVKFKKDGIEFVAKLDRITEDSIIDWKTSKKSKDNGIETDIQAIIYKEAYKNYKNETPKSVLFINLKNSDISHAKLSSDFEDYFWHEIVPFVYNSIEEGIFPATGWFQYYQPCKFCSFRKVCLEDVRKNRSPT